MGCLAFGLVDGLLAPFAAEPSSFDSSLESTEITGLGAWALSDFAAGKGLHIT